MLNPPSDLPFLQSLLWQTERTDGQTEALSHEEMLNVYERGWRYRDTLESPTPEELSFIRQLALEHKSWLIHDV